MAIVSMLKLNLVAMSYDKSAILNALQRTGATEVKLHYEAENTVPLSADCEQLRAYLGSLEAVLSCLSREAEAYNKANKIKTDALADGFEVAYNEFIAASGFKAEADALAVRVNALADDRREATVRLAKLKKTAQTARLYSALEHPFDYYCNTTHTRVRVGSVPLNSADALAEEGAEEGGQELFCASVIASDGERALVIAAYHKAVASATEEILQKYNFTTCPFAGDTRTGAQLNAELEGEISALEERIAKAGAEIYGLNDRIRPLKIYCDYLGFEIEKCELSEKMRATQTTFLLEAYVPEHEAEAVRAALDGVTGSIYYEFSEPAKDEIPPTLYKNNAVVKNFEAVTNMYSPANSREFDPNAVMAVFYSIFLGFIMADIGYGLIMLIGGGAIWLKTRARPTGLTRLAGVFAMGGICTILWGVLFNSFFGTGILPFTVMPSLRGEGSMWSLMGINVPAVLIISMLVGIVQLAAGYVCRAVQYWRRGRVWDGIWEGMTWALFCAGVFLAVIGLTEQFHASICTMIGGIIAAVGLGLAVLTAGRHEKLFGKFTKGFGAAYGVINFASDILSYARLYGLLLSGAVIAQIVSDYSIQFITGGNPLLIVLGVIIMLVGHAFNLAMGLLGAYIHDARLQYVEFYGRFFEGEGELFTPLGSRRRYINLLLK